MNAVVVGRIIEAQFGGLRPATVTYLGEGCDSTAFEVNGQWVFRFPKRADVEQQLLLERTILPVLSEGSPLPVPVFSFFGEPSADFPRCFVGYRKLPGVPAIQVEYGDSPPLHLARAVGRFLSWLHAFPAAEAARLGVPSQRLESLIEELRSDALADFDLVGTVTPEAPLETWYTYLQSGAGIGAESSEAATVVHNDLAAEHILVDPVAPSVTGVIDWSSIALSDPAADFAGMFHWGGDTFVSEILSACDGEIADPVARRAKFMAACRGVADVAFGLEMNRREYIACGIRALRWCAGAAL